MGVEILREDILVSVCFSDASDPAIARRHLEPVAKTLMATYRFWEILIVNETGSEAEFEQTLIDLPNIRYLSVVKGLDNTQRRVIAASEAIGDIVLITSVGEAAHMNLPAMIETAQAENAVVLGQRRMAALVEPLIVALGRASGFQASTRDMQTTAFPRTVLNRLLSDPNPVLALRFPPRDNTIKVLRQKPLDEAANSSRSVGKANRMTSRVDLLMRMVTEAGPTLLSTVAFLSALMVIGALLFAVYVVLIYLFSADVAEGWTTLSLAISGMLSFLGIAMFGISITLRKMAEIVRGRTIDYLVSERSAVDLFDSVSHALNVDTAGGEDAKRP